MSSAVCSCLLALHIVVLCVCFRCKYGQHARIDSNASSILVNMFRHGIYVLLVERKTDGQVHTGARLARNTIPPQGWGRVVAVLGSMGPASAA